jgi:hypothetical protein
MFKGLRAQRLAALFVVGLLGLNYPLVGLWDNATAVLGGWPIVVVAIFGVWLLLIALLAWIAER